MLNYLKYFTKDVNLPFFVMMGNVSDLSVTT